ncbi:TRIO and F-actin-binding protein [Manacus vitellinus]|uniref:TRIO and F-actin-binding protein n=1 Tax=Manacus vitellinus TaxID=328815 RepID=UPI00115CC90F|nr:TRIO and F-actin-binding protein [Manacus vitellinus]
MSDSVDDVPCMNFEANIFAKSLCQHCFRTAGAHQHAIEEHAVEVTGRDACSNPDPGEPWDALHILAPQCEVYVCVGPVEGTERWHESRRYPPLSPGAEGEHRETGTDPSTCADANSTLAREGEMTRLWDNTLGSGKRDMMSYMGHKEEVRSRAPQADRPSSPPKTCFAVDVVASRVAHASPSNGLLPVPEHRPASQKREEIWPKHRKTDPPWASTLPHAPAGSPSARNNPFGGSGHPAGSRVRESRGHPSSGGTEGRHGLERQEYTVLADLPKPKRLAQRDAVDRYGSRTLSPGRVEVERIFGCERRKSETLEAFQALEEGRVDRLDGKTPVPLSKGHLVRRQSSPSLPREPQLGGSTFPLQSSTSSSGSPQPHLNASKKHKPDLLNFKKGWMSILDEPGEWKKHWFVLTDSSLRYYRDSNAEEADDLDGEIDLRSCTDVTEFAVQRNYGFQIHTKDAVFTLSAMTSGIRRNWIEALRKNVRPVSAPDVTKLSDCDKENSFRNCVPQKGSLRMEEQQRPGSGSGSEGNSKGSHWKADGQRHAFDYVELSPLPQDPGNQGSSQRTKGSLRISDRTPKYEELERDLAIRSEERRKWFETPDGRVTNSDGPAGDSSRKVGEQDLPPPPLSEEQRIHLNEEIEKKWLELERLPLKDLQRVPLTALLNQSKGGHGDTNEALKKEIQSLRAQLESCRARNESLREAATSQGDSHVPRGYISQEACERSLAEMESSHKQVMEELQRHHQRELERLRQEKERLLAEEAAATAAAIEALKKAHREEMNKELGRTRSFQQCSSLPEALQKQHQLDVDSLKRELQVLSEQYSQKCLEIGELTQKAEEREQILQRCQQEGKDLLRKNQELQTRLSDEIGKLRSFISSRSSGDRSSHNNERSSCELEVLLRVKENELQYLKKEVQCLREELQMMQKDKRFASGKYQDVYAELNHIKVRSEREIEQLKEHLRLAMAALQEKESLCNSVGK